ncbi:MAG: metallophosphoesterase [Clostridia bacterium]|nr:metallophosphoesterase [Clostridia bacterium]
MIKDSTKILDNNYKKLVGDAAYNSTNATIKTITKDYSDKFDTLQICFLSDMHIGSCDFDIKGLTETLRYADSQENAVVFMLGDALNTAIVGSKSDAYEDILSPQEQLDIYSQILQIAKGDKNLAKVLKNLNDTGKIVVVHSGNHEDRIRKAVGISTTKIAADIAGVGDSFAPYYASTDIILRQPSSPDGKFHFGVITHHGTGISNIDGTFRLLRNVDNANLCVIGHTHQQSMKYERLVKVDENGKQMYHDVLCLTLPSSGGGTYGAGMSLPDTAKQSAVWMLVSSQMNPFANKLSSTGIAYPEIVPACAFFNPTNKMETHIKQKRLNATKRAITKGYAEESKKVNDKIDEAVSAIIEFEEYVRGKVEKSITEPKRKEPKGFDEYIKETEMGDK